MNIVRDKWYDLIHGIARLLERVVDYLDGICERNERNCCKYCGIEGGYGHRWSCTRPRKKEK